jgi:hypothetical protein
MTLISSKRFGNALDLSLKLKANCSLLTANGYFHRKGGPEAA